MSGVSGKLSSRVMNMKFMRFSKDESESEGSKENTPVEDGTSDNGKVGYRDSSEWFASEIKDGMESKKKRITIKKRKPVAIVSQNVSVTNLQKDRSTATSVVGLGRRVFDNSVTKDQSTDATGEPPAKGSKKRALDAQNSNDTEDTDDYELDRMFKDSIRKRKTSKTSKTSKTTKKN